MPQLIDKNDFIGVVPMSVNIPDVNVNLHCLDAQNIDTFPIMPITATGVNMLTDIENATSSSNPELMEFFTTYLKPFMVCMAHARFLLWQGNNITQFGIRVNQEDTSQPITDKTRAELIASSEHKANVYMMKFKEALEEANYTFDTVVYSYECNNKPRAKTRIKAI